MSKSTYRDYLSVLRTREVQPDFAKMAELVVATAPSGRWLIPVVALTLIVATVAGIWLTTSPSSMPQKLAASNNNVITSYSIPASRSESTVTATHQHKYTEGRMLWIAEPIQGTASKLGQEEPDTIPSLHGCDLRIMPTVPPAGTFVFAPAVATELPSSDSTVHGLFLELGLPASFWRQFNVNGYWHQIALIPNFVDGGYQLSDHIWLTLAAGRETFDFPVLSQSMTYRDTTFVHDGQTYHNVIGEMASTTSDALQDAFWIGGGLRYILGEGVRPIGEITAGASTYGPLIRQLVGVDFPLADHLRFAILAQATELFPQGSAWLTKAGVSASVSYRF